MARFVVVPQWQGSGSDRAMRLATGAARIAEDLPRSATEYVDVPLEAGSALDTGVVRASSVLRVREELAATLGQGQGPAVTVGGDCGVELAAVEHAASLDHGIAVVWFDAHADLNVPEESPSGAFHGMVLRSILGDGPPAFASRSAVQPSRTVLAGVRSMDPGEEAFAAESGVAVLAGTEASTEAILAALRATGATSVYVHIDLDVLDPASVTAVNHPEPFGLSVSDLLDAVKSIRAEFELAGAGIMEFAPADEVPGGVTDPDAGDDLTTILRLIAALRA
ncbi:arginase [Labedella gwakjiensis]|uniref:Arginase n=1 Tax=Labedella gwakjiensis TaxID=390269 RepID=A0A2P8GY66_9MICO|nr:arginase family protein [Labedella gwakjiensis]PSL38902.1 arginase [Labedella gwakjiensis]RUQ86632.1 arginase family protein [Labedella gwakjiensis]